MGTTADSAFNDDSGGVRDPMCQPWGHLSMKGPLAFPTHTRSAKTWMFVPGVADVTAEVGSDAALKNTRATCAPLTNLSR
jgi:hypothetical protein